jgi:TonB-dependent starch-binding outer membrane protein SusC
MCATERLAMEKKLSDSRWYQHGLPNALRAVGLSLLLLLALSRPALGQQVAISGTVTTSEGTPLSGVMVRVQGTDTRSVTAPSGKYFINAPADAVLTFALVGRSPVQITVSGRTTIDVTMARVAYLEEVVVTSYTEQRRADITGAVASVPIDVINRETGASVLQKLAAATPGVTVDNSGSPGSRSTVRIRGISSFQNNDPLYIVDGTPVQDTYVNWLNPEDITSIQVLKDASAASIYGSRASNGVILIETTKKGLVGPPRTTVRLRTGIANPVRGYDDFLLTNSLDYFKVVKASFQNAGLAVPTNIYGNANSPSVPAYIWPNNCGPVDSAGSATPGPCTSVNLASYRYPGTLIMPGSQGTNWWKAVFGTGKLADANLDVSGGSPDNTYGVSFNFYNQDGTAKYNQFKRGTVRVNTEFRRGKLNFGENMAIGIERAYGGVGDDNFGEGNILGKNILMQPVVPVRDVAGNFASGKAVGLGNNTNPLKVAYEGRNNISKNNRIFGNVFAGYGPLPALRVQTKFGFSVGQGSYNQYNPIYPENSEPTLSNGISEFQQNFTDWTWSNTATYALTYAQNTLNLLAGQEANAGNYRRVDGSIGNLLNTSLPSRYISDALGSPTTKNVFSAGTEYALLSFFGKADYNFAERYIASATLRRDGSSRLGPANRWGTFPAFGVGWHLTNESFMQGNHFLSDGLIRYGWGVTGNQTITAGRIVSQYGGDRGATFYDITGSNTSIVAGFRQTSIGNPNLKWEEDRSQNIGADLSFLDNQVNVVLDLYIRTTNNLLFDPALPATAGFASPPIVNIGSMENRGIDFSIGHRASAWNVTLTGSHYKNKIVKIDGVQKFFYGPGGTQVLRFGNPIINQLGSPISAFYGYVADGYFRDAADVTAHATQAGAKPGRIKFRDLNKDGKIDLNDRKVIGSPHPDFTAGLDLGYRWHSFDLAGTIFGTFGNDIFEAQKQFYVFRNFSTNVRKDLLDNSWTPTRQNAKYPRLDVNDTYSYALSSYYVEDGSYVRMRSLQLGYTVPAATKWIGQSLSGTRVYVQAENLFTITGYDGLDPALPEQSFTGAAGDVRDQFRGVDRGTYPSNRVLSIGVSTTF